MRHLAVHCLVSIAREISVRYEWHCSRFLINWRSVEDRRAATMYFTKFLPEQGYWDCGETFPVVMPCPGATFPDAVFQGRSHVFYTTSSFRRIIIFCYSSLHDAERFTSSYRSD